MLALLAHHDDELIAGVGAVGIGEQVLRGVAAVVILVTAVEVDGVAADAHARPGDETGVDGVAYGDIRAAGSLRAHIPLGGEARHQVGFGRGGGDESALGNGLVDGLVGFIADMEEEMGVRIDQPRHEGGFAEVEDLRGCRMLDRHADSEDPVAAHQHFAG